MDLFKVMRSFVTVADLGGFAAAARALGLSPPAVTRDVAALEQRLGCDLLRRTTRQVGLTDAGSRYLADARRILSEIAQAEASLAGVQGDLRGPIMVTAPATLGRLHVAPRVASFAARHPHIVFTTLFLDRMVDLIEEGVDVAVRIAHLTDSTAKAVRVGRVRRVVCASPAFLAEFGEPRTPRDLEGLEAVDLATYQMAWSFRIGGREKLMRPRTRFVANSVDVAIAAAEAGCGVVRLLSYQAEDAIAAGRLKRVLSEFEPDPVPVHVIHHDEQHVPARVRVFIDWLVAELRGLPALRH